VHNPELATLFACQDELIGLFEALTDVIFCAKDRHGRYIAANAAFIRRTGKRSKRDVIGSTSSDLFIAELALRYDEQDQAVLSTGTPLRDELELIRRTNGALGWYLTTKLPVRGNDVDPEPVGLVSVSRDLLTPSDENIAIEGLQSVVAYVRDNLVDLLRPAELAIVAGCSTAQLTRRMKRVFGLTATQYVLRVRVEKASELLTRSDHSISSVAADCGFYDQASFTHRFARLTNSTPAQFRSTHAARATHRP